jgi:hypothetical protein
MRPGRFILVEAGSSQDGSSTPSQRYAANISGQLQVSQTSYCGPGQCVEWPADRLILLTSTFIVLCM